MHTRIATTNGATPMTTRPRDTRTALDAYEEKKGVCRDFSHLAITMLRALEVPARLVSVYAPGLSPMDFHAVVEAHVDGQWLALDATRLAPRSTLLRIATGRDAAAERREHHQQARGIMGHLHELAVMLR